MKFSKISRVILVAAVLVLGAWLLSFSSGPGAETSSEGHSGAVRRGQASLGLSQRGEGCVGGHDAG